MIKSHKIYPNCVFHVTREWHDLNYYSALLAKVYWNSSTNIIRVCVTPFHPTTSKLNIKRKANKQIDIGSKAIATLYEFLCHFSPKCCNILLEVLFSYLPTRLLSHVFYFSAPECFDTESVNSINSFSSALFSDNINYFS